MFTEARMNFSGLASMASLNCSMSLNSASPKSLPLASMSRPPRYWSRQRRWDRNSPAQTRVDRCVRDNWRKLVGCVLLESLANSQPLRLDGCVVGFNLRHHVRRRRWRVIEHHRGHPRAAFDRAGAQRRRGHRQHRRGGHHAALSPRGELAFAEWLREGIEAISIAAGAERRLGLVVPSLQLVGAIRVVAVDKSMIERSSTCTLSNSSSGSTIVCRPNFHCSQPMRE